MKIEWNRLWKRDEIYVKMLYGETCETQIERKITLFYICV